MDIVLYFVETLRISPPGFTITKVCTEATELKNYDGKPVKIEKGMVVQIPFIPYIMIQICLPTHKFSIRIALMAWIWNCYETKANFSRSGMDRGCAWVCASQHFKSKLLLLKLSVILKYPLIHALTNQSSFNRKTFCIYTFTIFS